MQKIHPHLWFDKQAKEAAEFYVSVFPNSQVKSVQTLHNTPSGDADIVSFSLMGHDFMAISAGPLFKFNPSISFTITCATPEEADEIYAKLSGGGEALMPYQEYPWSKKYGWFNDKYGVSWQINTEAEGGRIIPTLMFTQENFSKCEEAIEFYKSVFKNSDTKFIARYEKGEVDDKHEGKIKHAEFMLEGQPFRALESSLMHKFIFNEAVSLMVSCKDQAEIDYYWEKLSAVPESEQCGWLKDKYGVSWQITPEILGELMGGGDQAKSDRVTQAFLKMKKFDIAELDKAAQG
jgi:predicted 3-demethylubiquinone-9 3-methyltransferase (glyoxalase superfamily)